MSHAGTKKLYLKEIEEFWQMNGCASLDVIIMKSPEQWTGRGMHQICYMHHKKYVNTNTDTYLTLLQIHSKPIRLGLLSLAALFLKRDWQEV